jgi:hypothetical protein
MPTHCAVRNSPADSPKRESIPGVKIFTQLDPGRRFSFMDGRPDEFPSDALVQRMLLILILGHAVSLFDAGFT